MIHQKTDLTQYDIKPEGLVNYLRYNGPHFNKKLFEFAISNMTVRSGGTQVKLSPFLKEQIDNILKVNGIKLENNQLYDDLEGKTFVITGSLNSFPNRDALKKVIEDRGGKVAGSVSSKTSYLINNDINSNSSKNKNAKKLGVPIITEEDFLNL